MQKSTGDLPAFPHAESLGRRQGRYDVSAMADRHGAGNGKIGMQAVESADMMCGSR